MTFFVMFSSYGLLIIIALTNVNIKVSTCTYCESDCMYKFPERLKFSVSAAAYQTEGAYRADGKGQSIWDKYTHKYVNRVVNGSNGDVACNSYYQFSEDVQLIKNIGFQVHRLSISWPRILPNGDLSFINKKGIEHYHKVFDTLLANGIEPMVTIYHWDLPQKLQDKGGWLNSSIIKYITDYANLLFCEYGDKVKLWLTINEPYLMVCGYAATFVAPGLNLSSPADYNMGRNILLAHASIYHLYNQNYRFFQNGQISIALNADYVYAANNHSESDRRAAEQVMEFQLGWFAHPIFSAKGDYPPMMRYIVDKRSRKAGIPSRLPYFTEKEKMYIHGSADFFSLNHYTSVLAKPAGGAQPNASYYTNPDVNVITFPKPEWPTSAAPSFRVVPEGFRKILNWIDKRYNSPPIFITENGYADVGQLNDQGRISYLQQYLREMSIAINNDGCNVVGYSVWSLLDDFEWNSGYTIRFGLTYINFQSADKKRIPKASSEFMRRTIKSRCVK